MAVEVVAWSLMVSVSLQALQSQIKLCKFGMPPLEDRFNPIDNIMMMYGVCRGRLMSNILPQGALIIQCRYGGQHKLDCGFSSLSDAVNQYSSTNNYTVTHKPGISELNTPVSLDDTKRQGGEFANGFFLGH